LGDTRHTGKNAYSTLGPRETGEGEPAYCLDCLEEGTYNEGSLQGVPEQEV